MIINHPTSLLALHLKYLSLCFGFRASASNRLRLAEILATVANSIKWLATTNVRDVGTLLIGFWLCSQKKSPQLGGDILNDRRQDLLPVG